MTQKRFAIFGSFSAQNMGDEAYLDASLEVLQGRYPDSQFTLFSFDPQDTLSRYQGIQVCPDFIYNVDFRRGSICQKLLRLGLLLPQPLLYCRAPDFSARFGLVNQRIRSQLDTLRQADVLLACGGGLLNEDYGLSLVVYPYLIWLAEQFGKQIVLLGQSVGPFYTGFGKVQSRMAIERADVITLREPRSLANMRKIGSNTSRTEVTTCSSVLLPAAPAARARDIFETEQIEETRPLIGFSIRRWFYPRSKDPATMQRHYKQAVAAVADACIQKLGASVVFVPTAQGDEKYAQEIRRVIQEKSHAMILSKMYTPREVRAIFSRFDLLIATAFHGLVLASCENVPIVSISYTFKCSGYMDLIDQGQFVCDIDAVTFDDLWGKVTTLWDRRKEIQGELEVMVKRLQAKALRNFELLDMALK